MSLRRRPYDTCLTSERRCSRAVLTKQPFVMDDLQARHVVVAIGGTIRGHLMATRTRCWVSTRLRRPRIAKDAGTPAAADEGAVPNARATTRCAGGIHSCCAKPQRDIRPRQRQAVAIGRAATPGRHAARLLSGSSLRAPASRLAVRSRCAPSANDVSNVQPAPKIMTARPAQS